MTAQTVWNSGLQVYETFDDDARTVTVTDQEGAEVDSRAYTAQENADADARAAQPAIDAEHAATKDRVRAIIDDLQAEKARAQAVLDTPNATINANPSKTIKDAAQSNKRIADACIDLAKYIDGR